MIRFNCFPLTTVLLLLSLPVFAAAGHPQRPRADLLTVCSVPPAPLTVDAMGPSIDPSNEDIPQLLPSGRCTHRARV
jgi:hypothetical protein